MTWISLKNKNIRPVIRNWFHQLIKQNVMENKPKIIRDKLNDKITRGKWTLFQQQKKKSKKGIRAKEKT